MEAPKRIANFARYRLRSELTLSGEVLYSAAATLRQGPAYLLGHNPGGDPDDLTLPTLGRSLDELPSRRSTVISIRFGATNTRPGRRLCSGASFGYWNLLASSHARWPRRI
jgi:hypothetical protein